ncbi:MAG: hypothetical protein HXS46_02775 [Theionarchaea archaeon]|nr:MAG: hypothetical protein AYK18_13025 [Theionarchaea archaeon DG-70]MBU7009588.1 hypothetical protein [Theionarchaea archaeon]
MIKILINEKTQKIFWFLWKNKKEPYTIRETAQKTGVSYGSTWSILKEFEELQIVYGIEKKKAYLYVLNFENPLCFHVWSLLNALKRENIDIDASLKEKIGQIKEGFAVHYAINGVSKIICCSEKRFKNVESMNFEDFKNFLHKKKGLYNILWNNGIILVGEKKFFDFMWKIAEKRVIGVGT